MVRGKKLTHIGDIHNLREAFDIQPGEAISLVGAGGKTTLMFALAGDLISHTGLVISTTTTKIFPPSSSDTPHVLISHKDKEILDFIINNGSNFNHITVASEKLSDPGKLKGVSQELLLKLCNLDLVNYAIIEADGAAQRPLKAPDIDFEPVIPKNTSLLIPVVGVDALGCELNEKNVFRSEIAAKLSGTALDAPVSTETFAEIITHPSGLSYGSPDQARIVPFINKTDLHGGLAKARAIAHGILAKNHPNIDRVVLGHAQLQNAFVEIIC
ncbi:MAG: putative selenium-dependent hydroxylase accessory protein YqeC [Desulfobacterales bacterium]|nr:putative selenium-dependent hydroxylase accessory protein YqeC [Desulfobacterales bacterium]